MADEPKPHLAERNQRIALVRMLNILAAFVWCLGGVILLIKGVKPPTGSGKSLVQLALGRGHSRAFAGCSQGQVPIFQGLQKKSDTHFQIEEPENLAVFQPRFFCPTSSHDSCRCGVVSIGTHLFPGLGRRGRFGSRRWSGSVDKQSCILAREGIYETRALDTLKIILQQIRSPWKRDHDRSRVGILSLDLVCFKMIGI